MRFNFSIFLLYFLLITTLLGCKTSAGVVAPVVHYRDSIQVQTEYIHDSIYHDRWHTIYIKGDTVYKTDSVVLFKWKSIEVHDTLRISTTDTVPVVVEKELTGNQRFLIRSGISLWVILVLLFLAGIVIAAIKLRRF